MSSPGGGDGQVVDPGGIAGAGCELGCLVARRSQVLETLAVGGAAGQAIGIPSRTTKYGTPPTSLP